MILTGKEIKKQVENGKIVIEPFDENKLNPNSYNITLADELYEVHPNYNSLNDTKKEPLIEEVFDFAPLKENEKCWVLEPNRLYLGRTVERTATQHYVPMIEGRSSIGRLGLFIHVTAGFGDVGFDGFWTLEIVATIPTILYPGIDIGQVFFHEPKGEIDLYKGKYNQNAGVQASGLWKEFSK